MTAFLRRQNHYRCSVSAGVEVEVNNFWQFYRIIHRCLTADKFHLKLQTAADKLKFNIIIRITFIHHTLFNIRSILFGGYMMGVIAFRAAYYRADQRCEYYNLVSQNLFMRLDCSHKNRA